MAVGARIEDLFALYNTLKQSMDGVDAMMTDVQGKVDLANEEWKGTGKEQFNQDWAELQQPLIRLCNVFAAAGTSVAFQHNKMAEGAMEADKHPHLQPVTSPR